MQEVPNLTPDQPHSEPVAPHEEGPAAPSVPAGGDALGQYPPDPSEFPSVPWGAELSVAHHALPKAPWTGRDILWAVLWGFGILTVLTMLFTLALATFQDVAGIQLPAATGLVAILAELGLLLPVWWFGVRKYHLSWSDMGLRDFAIARGLGLGCMFLLFAFAFNMLWTLFLSLFNLSPQPNLLPLFGSGVGGLLLALFTGGVVAPIAEEVFFRGFVFAGLYRQKGLWPAVVLSSILFALVHITPTSWPPIFLLGVIFAVLYERTGSIWPAVAAHGAVNSLSFVALYLLETLYR